MPPAKLRIFDFSISVSGVVFDLNTTNGKDIKLPDSLMTNYQYTITPQAEMTGEAHIITEEKRLFERFLRLLPDR